MVTVVCFKAVYSVMLGAVWGYMGAVLVTVMGLFIDCFVAAIGAVLVYDFR